MFVWERNLYLFLLFFMRLLRDVYGNLTCHIIYCVQEVVGWKKNLYKTAFITIFCKGAAATAAGGGSSGVVCGLKDGLSVS